jgi:hypothetical protein
MSIRLGLGLKIAVEAEGLVVAEEVEDKVGGAVFNEPYR